MESTCLINCKQWEKAGEFHGVCKKSVFRSPSIGTCNLLCKDREAIDLGQPAVINCDWPTINGLTIEQRAANESAEIDKLPRGIGEEAKSSLAKFGFNRAVGNALWNHRHRFDLADHGPTERRIEFASWELGINVLKMCGCGASWEQIKGFTTASAKLVWHGHADQVVNLAKESIRDIAQLPFVTAPND